MQQEIINSHDVEKIYCAKSHGLRKGVKLFFSLLIIFSTTATLPLFNVSVLPGFARNNGFIFVGLGLIAVFITERSSLRFNNFFSRFLPFVFVGFMSSILMAFILTGNVPTISGETPLSAITTGLMWIVFDAAIVYYVSYCYARCTGEYLNRVLDILLLLVLVISGIQALVMFGVPGSSALFNLINIGDWLSVFKQVSFERLVGVGSEPAAMSLSLGLLCLPYCYCRVANGGGTRYGVAFILLLLFGFLTKATTVYVTIGFVAIGILLLNIRKIKSKFAIVGIATGCTILAITFLVVSFMDVRIISADVADTFETVFGKMNDVGNQSTAYRTSTVVNDIEIFKDYPIFGVGDGNQGFFYAQNIPSWVLASGSTETLNALSGSIGVLNGGSFIPSIISGYGIVGCVLFLAWIVFCARTAVRRKKELGLYYDMFVVAMFACAPISLMAISFQGAPTAIFLVFCLPALGAER